MNRALPGWAIDKIRDGVPPAELRHRGDVAVFNALVRTAASALQRGWPRPDWEAEVGKVASRLGVQARLKQGRRERSNTAYHKLLTKAWAAAMKWLRTAPAPLDAEQIRERANDVTAAVAAFVADPDVPLPDAHRAVLAYAADFARNKGTTRPALSRRNVAKAGGFSERSARNALAELEHEGLLVLEVPGRTSKDPRRQRANLYRLPDADALATYIQYRGTRSMGRPAQVYGPLVPDGAGPPTQVYGPLSDLKETSVVSISASPRDLAEFLRRIQEEFGNVEIEEPAKVVKLRSVPTERRPAS